MSKLSTFPASAGLQGKRVYFACHPGDFEKYFEVICADILAGQDCVVYYNSEPEVPWDEGVMESLLGGIQLMVIPVTGKFLREKNEAREVELAFAIRHHIPVLPVIVENGLEEEYRRVFGSQRFIHGTVNSEDPFSASAPAPSSASSSTMPCPACAPAPAPHIGHFKLMGVVASRACAPAPSPTPDIPKQDRDVTMEPVCMGAYDDEDEPPLPKLPTRGVHAQGVPKASEPQEKAEGIEVSQVEFSAVVPKRFMKGEYSMVDISLYEAKFRSVVDNLIKNAESEVREVVASSQEIKKDTEVRIVLSSPDFEISDCDETQTWHGRYLIFSFPVEVPTNYAKKQILFTATVYFNGIIATKLKFIAKCSSWREQKIELTREDILTAFISYASQDRSRVATIIQGMQKARPDMDIFFDVESLRSGDDWKLELHREIEKRDVLYLCWSEYAKESKWVEEEWRYALSNKGLDGIEPIPLVSPDICPPPDELKSKHFNDKVLIYSNMG
ncbi:MAG: toll/interleukin-1 receptor domain-containing protein [Oscillospiraceae bacterium]|nr:toll/interleukin-1 receptor domain-containing protein [Oscillospiraceae bacterium]